MDRNFAQFPTLQSIEAQSEVSVDLKQNQLQPFISKIFMLCVVLQKQNILITRMQQQAKRNNSNSLKKSQIDLSNRDLAQRVQKLQRQNKELIAKNAVMGNQLSKMQRINADLQVYKERSIYNHQLEQKAFNLENLVKQAAEKRIQDSMTIQNLKREKSMLAFDANKTLERNKIKDLESQLLQQRSKLEAERKIVAELKLQIDKMGNQMRNLKESQIVNIKRQYDQKVQRIQIYKEQQFLKQSRATAENQNKLALISQQNLRLSNQIQHLRGLLKSQQSKTSDKQSQNRRLLLDLRNLQEQVKNRQKNQSAYQNEVQGKQRELTYKVQELERELKNKKASHNQMEIYISQKNVQEQELHRKIEKIQAEIQLKQLQNSDLKAELRKIKRKPNFQSQQCEICKIRSSNSIASSSKTIADKIKFPDLDRIIKQAQTLNMSNRKIDNLINHHELTSQRSIQLRKSSIGNSSMHH